jgi:anti-sigma factor RsiW
MKACADVQGLLHSYVDGELPATEQLRVEAHLVECEECRVEYQHIREVVDVVRGSQPLYPARADLSVNLESIVEDHRSSAGRRRRYRVSAVIGAFAATLVAFAVVPGLGHKPFTSFAADTHREYAHGALRLGVTSDEPAVVSTWLKSHLPFHLSLPDFAGELPASKSYSLVGAGMIKFGGQDVAYLAYTMADHPISLLVSSNANIAPASGETYTSGKLLFHFSSEKGLKLITWRDRGLSYALVSDVQVAGAKSCVVCHGSSEERRKFEDLHRLNTEER